MENMNKVFSSNIIRNENSTANNLIELLNIVPVKPLLVKKTTSDCDFWPKTGKHYVPKRKSRLKVKTVRNIRNVFEQDTYTYLLDDLEKQRNLLLKKIRDGTSEEESTKTLAKKILNSEQPVSRTAWEMLVHLNPEQHTYPKQWVLWNGRNIQLNGSKGGKYRYLCNCDVSSKQVPTIKKRIQKNNTSNRKKSLLKNSLNIKFKPGPLGRKMFLDDSHQKYHLGNIALVELPKLGLEIQPTYGMTLGYTISNFLDNLRNESGLISQTWAEFAVTVLGSLTKSKPVQLKKDCVTFDLNYKCDQHRMLMRLDHDIQCPAAKDLNKVDRVLTNSQNDEAVEDIMSEVTCIVDEIIDSVNISLQENKFYSKEKEVKHIIEDDAVTRNVNQPTKDKQKKKYSELDRLAVTVIRVPENTEKDMSRSCNKSYCSLGCVCDSLEYTNNYKQHCGVIECMFGCKCDFPKHENMKSLAGGCSETLPGLLNLNNEKHLKLSKEEQKFHQTVIVSGEKSILLKSQKRNWKSSKKYADFYDNMPLKQENKIPKTLSVFCLKLDCKNIEPWCMVHNLYKCFCKGKFTETGSPTIDSDLNNKDDIRPLVKNNKLCDQDLDKCSDDTLLKPSTRQFRKSHLPIYDQYNCDSQSELEVDDQYNNTCARVNIYKGRKYDDEYYHNTNIKISDMERNDNGLQKKLMILMNDKKGIEPTADNAVRPPVSLTNKESIVNDKHTKNPDLVKLLYLDNEAGLNLDTIHKKNKSKLVAWLEYSYQQYKQQLDQGYVKKCLDPPRKGKLVLYTWDLILGRYRERKNLFLVTKKKPYRIFIVIHNNHPLFKHCINIDDIKFDDLGQYPLTVKNLLTNATGLTDIFCILRGISHCWELVGSVNKLLCGNKNKGSEQMESSDCSDTSTCYSDSQISFKSADNTQSLVIPNIQPMNIATVTDNIKNFEASKWFVMTLENDFTEIQFYKKGFFVQYDSIVRAINVARRTGKTVRLSSKKCADKCNDPKFGIYAIPNANEDCVFVGPYEIDEPMGIETVKTSTSDQRPNRTRGVWITTKKIDNLKVIDNPLSFILPTQYSEMVPLDTDNSLSETSDNNKTMLSEKDSNNLNEATVTSKQKVSKKIVKPIKIRRTNGFYHLASNGTLQKLSKHSSQKNESTVPRSLLINASINELSSLKSSLVTNYSITKSMCNSSVNYDEELKNDLIPLTPLTEKSAEFIPSEIKITAVYSTAKNVRPRKVLSEKGMSILKPEEINKKLFVNKLRHLEIEDEGDESDILSQDIEKFLASSVKDCPQDDVYIISDDEEDESNNPKSTDPKEVFIRCTNIEGIGWLNAKRDMNSLLSFEFPGFKYSMYYNEKEAFAKINQVLSRKIYVPRSINLLWEVVESASLITRQQKMKKEDLGSDLILTKKGIRSKNDLRISGRNILKTYTRKLQKDTDSVISVDASVSSINSDEENHLGAVTGFEESSRKFEYENKILWDKTVANKIVILDSLTNASNEHRNELTESLRTIMVMAEEK